MKASYNVGMKQALYLFSEPWKLLLKALGWPLRAVANAPRSEREMAQWETDMLNADGPPEPKPSLWVVLPLCALAIGAVVALVLIVGPAA